MCKACPETGLFVFMCFVYSLCLIDNGMPVCPTYELLQVLHFSLCIPLECVLDYCIIELFVDGVRGMEGYV
jgi:hypothetical protein